MSEIICITNRKLCGSSFLEQIEKISAARPDSIILREKDLSENEYSKLAEQVLNICKNYDVPCTLHYFYKTAISMNIKRIHLPLHLLEKMTFEEKKKFDIIGVSCHSIEDAKKAQNLGASYVTAGHIFQTDCKAGLPGRGLDFLREVKKSIDIPVYAIGGIDEENASDVISAGADGICIMSGFMKSSDPLYMISKLREVTHNG